jgi:predicted phage gp36 major capsid-like protein
MGGILDHGLVVGRNGLFEDQDLGKAEAISDDAMQRWRNGKKARRSARAQEERVSIRDPKGGDEIIDEID